MADNLALKNDDATSVGTLAADDIGGIHFPRTKLVHGADGTNDGDVSTANPLPVDLREAGGNALTTGAGAVATGTPRVTLASDDPGVALLTTIDADTGSLAGCVVGTEVQVDIVGSLPAGSNLLGTVSANIFVDTGAGVVQALADLSGNLKVCGVAAHDAAVSSNPVLLGMEAKDFDGAALPNVVSAEGDVVRAAATLYGIQYAMLVNEDGSAVGTVNAAQSGAWTVTANAGTNLDTSALAVETGGNLAGCATSLAVIDDWDETNRCAVNLIASQAGISAGAGAVAANTPRVTLASDDLAVALLTTIDVDTGSAATSLAVMADWDNAASNGASVSGGVAHDAADAGEPVKIGHRATTALSAVTLVANNDRTDAYAGVDGVPIVRPHCNLEDVVTGNASNTDGTSTECIAAQAAGIKTYLTSIILTNTSSSNIYVEIKDGSTTKVTIPVPANGGAIFNPPVPLPGTAATAWNFDPSAAATTVFCSTIGFKSKV